MDLMRILIVDDDRALRDALRRALVLGGYETVPVESGEAALAEVARWSRTRSCSTSGCRTSTGWRSAAACADPGTACRF